MNRCELFVDNFAGGGGASTGIEVAIGKSVDIAINHDPAAIAMHKVNHPNTKHYCEDVWEVDPIEACDGNPVALAWFSPDCKHFSRAKGGKPVDNNIRGLAWVSIKWAMGFLIGLAGHKRYATKNAKFLMHDGSNFIYDSGAKAQDRMRFDSRVEERTKAYILSRGNLTSEEYDAKFRVEWYMFADEAKERGFVDYIIGEDCDIDEVI